ncbi:MAG: hypothetical protein Q7T91_00540 [Sulfuricurvum sp.]|nr:hypothetical protein [Sulfuricurvum sp.]
MIVKIDSGVAGWSKYVVDGTDAKPRDHSKIELIEGDFGLGDKLCASLNYKTKYYRLVIGFKGKPSIETIKAAYEEWKQLFMCGFEECDYHIDCVLHMDTDDYHLHIRIPKVHLHTNTQLNLYYHKADLYRKDLIQQYLDLNYHLESPLDNKPIMKEEGNFYLNEWREQQGQEPLDFSVKNRRKKAIENIHHYLQKMHENGFLKSHADVLSALENIDLTISKMGYDQTKQQHYHTFENETGKIRLEGELFNPESPFWKHSNETQSKEMAANRSKRDIQNKNDEMQRLFKLIEQENKKRIGFVQKRYRSKKNDDKEIPIEVNDDYGGEIINDERIRCVDDAIERTRSLRAEQQTTITALKAESERIYQQVAADIGSSVDSLEKRGKYRLRKREYTTSITEFTDAAKRAAKPVIAAISAIKRKVLDQWQSKRDLNDPSK